jgi:hypothetical protein
MSAYPLLSYLLQVATATATANPWGMTGKRAGYGLAKRGMAANEAFASVAAILVSLVRGGFQRRLGGLDVRCLLALGASGDVKRYALTFL